MLIFIACDFFEEDSSFRGSCNFSVADLKQTPKRAYVFGSVFQSQVGWRGDQLLILIFCIGCGVRTEKNPNDLLFTLGDSSSWLPVIFITGIVRTLPSIDGPIYTQLGSRGPVYNRSKHIVTKYALQYNSRCFFIISRVGQKSSRRVNTPYD
jgi:hypothetical protein